jgi:hypothetical protein
VTVVGHVGAATGPAMESMAWHELAGLVAVGAGAVAAVLGVLRILTAELRQWHDRREARRSRARRVHASLERRSWRPTSEAPEEPLMYVVVRNGSDETITHVEADVPGWGWTPIPMPLVASRTTLAAGEQAGHGLGRKPPTWTPCTCSVRFTDSHGRRWRRDAAGLLRRERRQTTGGVTGLGSWAGLVGRAPTSSQRLSR